MAAPGALEGALVTLRQREQRKKEEARALDLAFAPGPETLAAKAPAAAEGALPVAAASRKQRKGRQPVVTTAPKAEALAAAAVSTASLLTAPRQPLLLRLLDDLWFVIIRKLPISPQQLQLGARQHHAYQASPLQP
jgi:hypothetical protein